MIGTWKVQKPELKLLPWPKSRFDIASNAVGLTSILDRRQLIV